MRKNQIERLVNEIYTIALENIDFDKAKCVFRRIQATNLGNCRPLSSSFIDIVKLTF